MAISTQGFQLAWQRVLTHTRSAQAIFFLKAVKSVLSQINGSPALQYVGFADLGADKVIADAATRVHVIYLKKQNTATAAFFKGDDSATATSGTASIQVQELNTGKDEVMIFMPQGWQQASGYTVGSDTGATSATNSTAGDGPDGFVLIGKP